MTTKVDVLTTNNVLPIFPQKGAKESHAYNSGHQAFCCFAKCQLVKYVAVLEDS